MHAAEIAVRRAKDCLGGLLSALLPETAVGVRRKARRVLLTAMLSCELLGESNAAYSVKDYNARATSACNEHV